MLQWSLKPRSCRRLWVALGFFCCALIVFTGLAQVAHTHLDGQPPHSDCALCHTANLTVQATAPLILPHVVRAIATISSVLRATRAKRLISFSLFTRPPPVLAVVA